MNSRELAIAPAMLAAWCPWGHAADWPTYGHDNARSGVTVEKLAPPRAGVIVDGGVACFACGIFPNEGVALAAVDAKTGELLWRNDTFGHVYQNMPNGGTHGFTGLSPQGYLPASQERVHVPSGRAVPAAFSCKEGRLLFWHGGTHHEAGTWATLAGDLLYSEAPSAGCIRAKLQKLRNYVA